MEEPNTTLARLLDDESGVTATEYLIVLILVACYLISIVKVFGMTVEHKVADANNAIARLVVF